MIPDSFLYVWTNFFPKHMTLWHTIHYIQPTDPVIPANIGQLPLTMINIGQPWSTSVNYGQYRSTFCARTPTMSILYLYIHISNFRLGEVNGINHDYSLKSQLVYDLLVMYPRCSVSSMSQVNLYILIAIAVSRSHTNLTIYLCVCVTCVPGITHYRVFYYDSIQEWEDHEHKKRMTPSLCSWVWSVGSREYVYRAKPHNSITRTNSPFPTPVTHNRTLQLRELKKGIIFITMCVIRIQNIFPLPPFPLDHFHIPLHPNIFILIYLH